jgi:hypothetical protein
VVVRQISDTPNASASTSTAQSSSGSCELQPIFDKLETYLPELPGYLRDAFTPKSSLFDLLATRFGSVIRLKEHFCASAPRPTSRATNATWSSCPWWWRSAARR